MANCAVGGQALGGGRCGVLPLRRWNGGERWFPSRGPILGKKWGKEPQREEVLPSGLPSGGVVWGEAVPLTGYLACGPPSERPVTARPPAGRAGNGAVPFGRRQRGTVWFPAFSSRQQTTSPARPSRWAGHEALVLEAAGQAHTDPTTFPRSSTREWGSKGEEPPSPWCSFPYFFQEIGPRLGKPPFPRRSNGVGEEPHTAPIPTAMGFKALQSAPSAHPAAPPGAPAAPLPHGGTGFPSHSPRQCPRRRRRPPRGRSPGTPSPPR